MNKRGHGEWVEWWDDNYLSYCHKCSECGGYPLTKEGTMHDEVLSAYCPHCGAKMDGDTKRVVGFYKDLENYDISKRLEEQR